MRQTILVLLLIFLSFGVFACKNVIQYSKPDIVIVNTNTDLPQNVRPVFLDAPNAFGKYYMEIEYTNKIPNVGWIVENTGLFPKIIPAYPKPINKHIIGVAKEPAYKLVDE